MQEGTDQPPLNHETLWAREGDVMIDVRREMDAWSPFSSLRTRDERAKARIELHGFDFRVESKNGTKRMIRI